MLRADEEGLFGADSPLARGFRSRVCGNSRPSVRRLRNLVEKFTSRRGVSAAYFKSAERYRPKRAADFACRNGSG
jgi:hypothetical protein